MTATWTLQEWEEHVPATGWYDLHTGPGGVLCASTIRIPANRGPHLYPHGNRGQHRVELQHGTVVYHQLEAAQGRLGGFEAHSSQVIPSIAMHLRGLMPCISGAPKAFPSVLLMAIVHDRDARHSNHPGKPHPTVRHPVTANVALPQPFFSCLARMGLGAIIQLLLLPFFVLK